MKRLARAWSRAHQAFPTYPKRRFLSPIFHAHHEILLPLLREVARGALLDIGCGRAPFRDLLTSRVARYDTLDHDPRIPGLTYYLDVQDLTAIADETYDTVLCLEVLEHVRSPSRALSEIHRILRPGGVLACSVPHLSRLHDEPNDFYRFTRFGLEAVLQEAGFAVRRVQRLGGLATFLGHQLTTWATSVGWSVPWIGHAFPYLFTALLTWPCRAIDRRFDRNGRFATGFVAVAAREG